MTTTTETHERTRPVRATVDLDPELHRQLRLWCVTNGVPSRSQSGMFRALAVRMLADPELSAEIAAELSQT